MSNSSPKFHTLDITFNEFGPYTVVAPHGTTISATIGTYSGMRAAMLAVSYELDKNTTKHYRIKHLVPGDRLKFTYDGPNVDIGSSIDKIELHDDATKVYRGKKGFRLGFDVIDGGDTRRLSHPEGGGFNVMISNVPKDHARVAVNAGNDVESWSWQQKDLHAGDSFEIKIVETNWCDPFPKVDRFVPQAPS